MASATDNRFVSFLLRWHGIPRRRAGLDGLRQCIRQLQGLAMPFSELESSILAARVRDYSPMQLDELIAAGEVVWQGDEPLGSHDGYLSLYLRGEFPRLGRISVFADGVREQSLRSLLLAEDALDFAGLAKRLGGFPDDLLRTLWQLVWSGEVTSDSLAAWRSRRSSTASRHQRRSRPRYATRQRILPGASGRWTLLSGPASGFAAQTDRDLAQAAQLLDCYGILGPPTVADFDSLVPLLERLHGQGRAVPTRLLQSGDAQELAAPDVEAAWQASRRDRVQVVLAATDPANPFGLSIPWPTMANAYRPRRAPGARVLIHDGRLVGYLSRTRRHMHIPDAPIDSAALARLLHQAAGDGPLYLESVDDQAPYDTPWHEMLVKAGFSPSRRGYLLRSGG